MLSTEECQALAADGIERERDLGYVIVSLSETGNGYMLARAHRNSGKTHGPIYYAASYNSAQAIGDASRAAFFDDPWDTIAKESAIDALAYAIELNSYGV